MESCGSWKECDSEYYPLKEEEMKLYQNSKILGSHFYSAWIPIQKRKWIKQWVLGCNFSDKVLHFRYGLQSPVAKGSFKKTALGFAKFPWGPPESFDVEIFLIWSAHPVVLHYHISLQPLTGPEVIIKILNSYYNALINQSKQLPWQWYIHQRRQPCCQTVQLSPCGPQLKGGLQTLPMGRVWVCSNLTFISSMEF